MILHIDTKDQKVVRVSLKKDGKVIRSLSERYEYGSQVLLSLIEKLLISYTGSSRKNRSGIGRWDVLNGIEVEAGPGSFTGLRVGVSVANALGFALQIPVNGEKIENKLVY